MNFDDILVEIGEFGLYQKVKFFLLCLPSIILGLHSMGAVFLTAVPKFRCQIPGYSDDTYSVRGGNHSLLLTSAIPSVYSNETCKVEYERCEVYENARYASVSVPGNMTQFAESGAITRCSSWVYDQTVFERTIITEFNLVCGMETMKSVAQTVMMVGVLCGSIVFGAISDRFGRKKTLILSILLQLIFAIATAFSPGIIIFMILRMLMAASSSGIYLSAYVLGVELSGPSKRMWTGLWTNVTWAVGVIAMSGMAYGMREWNHLQLAISVPMALFLSYWWLIPESPRWLIAKGRYEEALKIIADIARWNKKPFSADYLEMGDKPAVAAEKPWKMFTSWILLVRCLVIFWNWIVVTMVYYGLSLNAGNLAGDVYLNTFLNGLVEFASYFVCMVLWDRLGRRIIQISSMILGGTACICTIIPVYVGTSFQCEAFSLATVNLVLSLIGKCGASIAFATIYIWSSEIFPTVLRNGSIGISSMLARIGGMVAPFIADLTIYVGGRLGQALPLLIFGVCSVSAGLVALILPETLNQKLPDTVEEAKQFGRKSSKTVWLPGIESADKEPTKQTSNFSYLNQGYIEASFEKKC